MSTQNLLFKNQYAINEHINIIIPTVGQILDNEDAYYSLVSLITAMPIDLLVQLDDAGIDFTAINEYELFLMLFNYIKSIDTSLVFGDLDLSKFEIVTNKENNCPVLRNEESNIVIDRYIHGQISAVMRKIHHIEKNTRRPANEEAKKYMLERARAKMKRNKNRRQDSELEQLVIALVNTEQYKYNFEETKDLTIYQFNESVKQVISKIDYEHRMSGVYAGTINPKELSQNDFNWLTHK